MTKPLESLIESYEKRERDNSLAWQARREREKPNEDARRASSLAHLRGLGAEIRFENGYVFAFVLQGRYYSLCDQTERVVGRSWIVQPYQQQEFLERDYTWCDKYHSDGSAIREAVDYRDEIQNESLAHWAPPKVTQLTA